MKNLVLHDVKNDFFVSFPLFCSWAVLLDHAFLCWQAHGFDALNKEKKKNGLMNLITLKNQDKEFKSFITTNSL